MKVTPGARVVLLRPIHDASGAVVELAGRRGVVKRSTRAVVIVVFEGGRTIPVKLELLGNDQS